jgi:putative oxidoreductase
MQEKDENAVEGEAQAIVTEGGTMERVLGKYAPYLYALLRIIAGLMFACHGAQKLFGVLGGLGGQPGATAPLFSLMGLAGVIEFVGGLCIAFGFLASYAAFMASGQMAVAYFMGHAPRHPWPIQNQGELAVLYCFLFLYIAAKGAGRWSIKSAQALTPMEKAEQNISP